MQPDTGGTLWPVPLLAREIVMHVDELRLDGMTISGGEPLAQSAGLRELVTLVRQTHPELDTLVYTGYSLLDMPATSGMAVFGEPRIFLRVTDWIDTLIDGEYQAGDVTDLALRGSRNQTIHRLTPLGHKRFPSNLDDMPQSGELESFMEPDGIFVAGIPVQTASISSTGKRKGVDHGRTTVSTL